MFSIVKSFLSKKRGKKGETGKNKVLKKRNLSGILNIFAARGNSSTQTIDTDKTTVLENLSLNGKTTQSTPSIDETRMLKLLKEAEKKRKEAWKYIQRKKTMHTRIPIYTGNPFTVE